MAESYDIHLTDPLSAAFQVRAFTSNGTIFPTSASLNDTAVGAETSLLVYGKGHPEYGERTSENILHILENFSGSTEPKNPVSGQLWYERFTVIRSGGIWYQWTDGVGWAAFVPLLVPTAITDGAVNDGDYWFDGADLYLAVKEDTHPLAPTWLPRVFEDRSVGVPTANDYPRKVLKVYNGVEWETVNTAHESEVAPAAPLNGDLWYDNTVPQLKIYNGSAFVSVADLYVRHDGSVPLTANWDVGGFQIKNLTDPTDGQDAATRDWVLTITGAAPSALDDLSDVTISGPSASELLKFNGAQWINDTIDLTDLGITASATELNYSTGVTSSIQTQINNLQSSKLDLTGGTITGVGTITLSRDPVPGGLEAATAQYVDSVAGSAPPIALEDVTDVIYEGGSPAIVPVTDDVLIYNGTNWTNGEYVHVHTSDEVTHTSSNSFVRDLNPTEYPTVPLDTLLESTIGNVSTRLNRLDDFARREVFTVAGSPATNTDFTFTDGNYRVGSNRLAVYVNGVKQYASERARQSIRFDQFKNLSSSSLLGLPAHPAGSPALQNKYYLDVAIDGETATSVEFTLNDTSRISDIVGQLNVALTSGLSAGSPLTTMAYSVWNKIDRAIHIFSFSTGNGSSIEISEPAVDGLLTALTNVALGSPADPDLPVLNYQGGSPAVTIIYPPFPSNVTQITSDLAYEEVNNAFNPTYFGQLSSSIRFNSALPAGAIVEMISESTADIIN